MKKLLSIALCATAVSAFADPAEAVLGQVGVTEITSSLQNTIVAVSYDDLAGASGSGMVVSNFVKTTNLTVGDQLWIYVNGEYSSWILTEGVGSAKYWAKNDITLKVEANGDWVKGTGSQAADVTRKVGTGIWLCRAAVPSEAFKFYIYGKPVSNPQTEIAGGAINLVGNPTTNNVPLTTAILADATAGDRIEVPTGTGILGRQAYTYDKTGNQWWTTDPNTHLQTTGLPTIPASQGFWYVSAPTGTSFTISWPQSN